VGQVRKKTGLKLGVKKEVGDNQVILLLKNKKRDFALTVLH